jgi:pyruvate dehydrogenase E1 component
MGAAGEGQNITHQKKKMDLDDIRAFRDRFRLPIPDEKIEDLPYYKLPENSEEQQYLMAQRERLGGSLPARRLEATTTAPKVPGLDFFSAQLEGSGKREVSTTMAFVRILSALVKDKDIGPRVVPIVPDEARTFGMEGMFRQIGIYSSVGQLYTPQDADQLSYYKEDIKGQILEEGINEAGSMCSWIAAATAYANHNVQMIPFYIYYSMFGFQRIGDFAWAAGDLRARGFLIGGTAGRTTLAGEGLQHQDGHSLLVATTIPNCRAYDPCYSYELAVIIQDGLRRMCDEKESIFYYIACMNENYTHPAMPEGAEDGIIRGMYRFRSGGDGQHRVQLLGSGTILREVIAAAELLQDEYQVAADIWSVTSFSELRREAMAVDRWNERHPEDAVRTSYVESCFESVPGPFIAATDYIKTVPDQIRKWVPGTYRVLGTDGFGRSDGRAALRDFFEVDRRSIVVAALKALADQGAIDAGTVAAAIANFRIDPDKPDPVTL